MTEQPEYAVADSYVSFIRWVQHDLKRRARVRYLDSAERVEVLLAHGAPRGRVHRLPGWESSPAREAVERLEAPPVQPDPRD